MGAQAVTPDDSTRFFGFLLDLPVRRLWWQDAGAGVRPLAEHPIATGHAVEGPWRRDGVPSAAAVEGLRTSLVDHGWRPESRVLVAVDAEGRCVLTDGAHRACAALVEGRATVPACIVYRSAEWWRLRYLLLAIGGAPTLYQPVDHPDLAAWPCWRVDTDERARVITTALAGCLTVVDLACHTGALSRRLARQGFSVLGLDTDTRAIEAARILLDMDGESAAAEFATCAEVADVPAADAVVCLSLLNHHQTDGRDADGREIFRRCVAAAPLVILDAPAPGEPVGGSSAYADPHEVLRWCASVDPDGRGEVLAPRSDVLQRPLLLWRRRIVPPVSSASP